MPNVLKTSQGKKGKYREVPAFVLYPNIRHRRLRLHWITRTKIQAKIITVIKKWYSLSMFLYNFALIIGCKVLFLKGNLSQMHAFLC